MTINRRIASGPIAGLLFLYLIFLRNFWKKNPNAWVPNYLPSTSAAIGGFTPEKYIWRICIALHSAPRFMVAVAYYNFHTALRTVTRRSLYELLAAVTSLLHITENASLVGLTYISSTENHDIHEKCFITFMVTSLFYMLFTCVLYKWGRQSRRMTPQEMKSYRYKKILFLTNISSFFSAVYFFFRHNAYCEPGVYTLFSFLEYVTIVSNIAFHGTIILDFEGSLTLGPALLKTAAD